jgi:phosphoribosyl 1,2-cyclic phosphodiesterase
MTLSFPGTRGEIEPRSRLHRMHTCLRVGHDILVDCGADWLGKFERLKPKAIVLTHAHLDHVGGLQHGFAGTVYATVQTWERIKRYPIQKKRTVTPRQPFRVGRIGFEAFTLEHSLIAPAVGYRITAGDTIVFYAPDLVSIHEQSQALARVALYIGDGASITRPLIRRRGKTLIGHASVRQQLDWCRDESVPRVVITHCGSQIVKDAGSVSEKIGALARERGVEAEVAYDGMELTVRKNSPALRPDTGRSYFSTKQSAWLPCA